MGDTLTPAELAAIRAWWDSAEDVSWDADIPALLSHVAALTTERDSYRARVAELEAAMPDAETLDGWADCAMDCGLEDVAFRMAAAAADIRALTPAPPATEASDRDATETGA